MSERRTDPGQYALAGLLAAIGAYTIYDASTLRVGFNDPVGPRLFPFVIGSVMVLLAVLLAIATARGDVPEPEGGEDVDLTTPPDWATVARLVGVVILTIVTLPVLGWAISGALLFAGSAWSLGSRTPMRDIVIGAVMSVATWYFFYVGLDIPLSPGILDGIL